MALKLPNLGWVETAFDPRLAETFRSVQNELNVMEQKAGVSATATATPPLIRSIMVQANAGTHEIAIVDPDGQSQPSLGIHYFVDHDISPAFSSPTTVHLGPSRNAFVNLGNQTVYWRAYSQSRNSKRSGYIVHGGMSPIPVNAAGSPITTRFPSQGSGGDGGRGGFGGS